MDGTFDAGLASEALIGRVEERILLGEARRQVVGAGEDLDPARVARREPAARRVHRDGGRFARFEEARPVGDLERNEPLDSDAKRRRTHRSRRRV